MSIPARSPADVMIRPSSTKSTSGSTFTREKRRANSAAAAQCVVAFRPSSNPAAPRINAPVQWSSGFERLSRPS
jgi:hypothetical protein